MIITSDMIGWKRNVYDPEDEGVIFSELIICVSLLISDWNQPLLISTPDIPNFWS